MDVIVDGGIIFKYQKHGGILRMFSEILPRMCDADPSVKITTLLQPDVSLEHLPEHKQIYYKSIPEPGYYFRPYRLWKPQYPRLRQWGGRVLAGSSRNKIWLSTYYTTPVLWRGRRVVVAYDFIHERFKLEHWQNAMESADATIASKARAISSADLVICISEATQKDLIALYHTPPEKTAVVHLAHSPVFQPLHLPASRDDNFLLYIGKRSRYKGFITLLKAFSRWNHPSLRLVCVGGSGWEQSEIELISQLGLQDKVKLLASVDDNKLCELYNQVVMFVYPSEYEGFGIPLLEAMACGCPVVASCIPSTVEVAQDVPYYFTPGNENELKDALERAFCDSQIDARKEKGLLLSSGYSWDRTAREYLSLFSKLM